MGPVGAVVPSMTSSCPPSSARTETSPASAVTFPEGFTSPQLVFVSEVLTVVEPMAFSGTFASPELVGSHPGGTTVTGPCASLSWSNPGGIPGVSAGEIVEIYGFDHAIGDWGLLGTGTVQPGATEIIATDVLCEFVWHGRNCDPVSTAVFGFVTLNGDLIEGADVFLQGETTRSFASIDPTSNFEFPPVFNSSTVCRGGSVTLKATATKSVTTANAILEGMSEVVIAVPGATNTDIGEIPLELVISECGDATAEGIEKCDDGPANSDEEPDACRTDCTLPRCGDGVVDLSLDEECDDGNAFDGDGCNSCTTCFATMTEYADGSAVTSFAEADALIDPGNVVQTVEITVIDVDDRRILPGGAQIGRSNNVAVVTGFLDIASNGDYHFRSVSNDGARLRIDLDRDGDFDDTVEAIVENAIILDDRVTDDVSNDAGPIALATGSYAFEFTVFNGPGGTTADLYYSSGGATFTQISCGSGDIALTRTEPVALPSLRVFVTSLKAPGFGTFGGLSGADAICQTFADDATLGGSWAAWLSDSTTDARDRIPDAEYRDLTGRLIARNKDDLTDGTVGPGDGNGPFINELGLDAGSPAEAYTGTNPDGTGSGVNCNDWTGGGSATVGRMYESDTRWTNNRTVACGSQLRLYCFEKAPAPMLINSPAWTGSTFTVQEFGLECTDGFRSIYWQGFHSETGEAFNVCEAEHGLVKLARRITDEDVKAYCRLLQACPRPNPKPATGNNVRGGGCFYRNLPGSQHSECLWNGLDHYDCRDPETTVKNWNMGFSKAKGAIPWVMCTPCNDDLGCDTGNGETPFNCPSDCN